MTTLMTLTDEEIEKAPFAMFEIRVRLTSPDGETYDLKIPDFCSKGLAALLAGQLEDTEKAQQQIGEYLPEHLRKELETERRAVNAMLFLIGRHPHDDGFGMGRELVSNPQLRAALEPLRHTEEF